MRKIFYPILSEKLPVAVNLEFSNGHTMTTTHSGLTRNLFCLSDGVRRDVHLCVQLVLHVAAGAGAGRVRAGRVRHHLAAVPQAVRPGTHQPALQQDRVHQVHAAWLLHLARPLLNTLW